MKWVTCQDGKLQTTDGATAAPATGTFTSGDPAWDALAPAGGFARRAVHELLFDDADPPPTYPAVVLARGASAGGADRADLVWIDVERTLYPPAVAAAGVRLDRFHLIRPPAEKLAWATAECLRCPGIVAVVAGAPAVMSRVVVRRFQLAAEAGATVGILLRPTGPGSDVYAAATRWLVRPAPGGRAVQRWDVQLIHGHGGQVGRSVILEQRRDPDDHLIPDDLRPGEHPPELPRDLPGELTRNPAAPGVVRPPAALADRPPAAAKRPARASG